MPTPSDITSATRGWIGTPYQHQASLKGAGCDCLGLVRGVWRELYGTEPETAPAYSPDWAEASRDETLALAGLRHLVAVPDLKFREGDVLLFRWKPHLPAKHAAIAVNDHCMVHAHDGVAVCEVSFSPWWLRRLAFVFRFPNVT